MRRGMRVGSFISVELAFSKVVLLMKFSSSFFGRFN
jgi:hypothetical protein